MLRKYKTLALFLYISFNSNISFAQYELDYLGVIKLNIQLPILEEIMKQNQISPAVMIKKRMRSHLRKLELFILNRMFPIMIFAMSISMASFEI
jgi:hypothetical protein